MDNDLQLEKLATAIRLMEEARDELGGRGMEDLVGPATVRALLAAGVDRLKELERTVIRWRQ